jgi:hypothetical protein
MHWEEAPKPASPLLIELQGNRYVRISGESSTAQVVNPSTALQGARLQEEVAPAEAASAPHAEPPPTVFVFRDGHQEESSDYSIVGGIIYASANYWTEGSWSKKIPVAELDLPATLRANEKRGVHFVLPSAPNQVVTRP